MACNISLMHNRRHVAAWWVKHISTQYGWMRSRLTPTFLRAPTAASQVANLSCMVSPSLPPKQDHPFFSVQSLRWNLVHAERVLYVVPAAQSAFDPGPMGRKHVQRTICNGKTNPVKKDFAEWGNGVQLSCVLVTDAFSPAYSLKLHVHLNPPVACGFANGDITAFVSSLLSSCKSKKKNNYCNAFQ